MARLTNTIIDERIFNISNGDYIRLGEYKNACTKFLIRHNICRHEYYVSWANFSKGRRCPECCGNQRMNESDVDKRIYELVSNEYSRVSEYKNAKANFTIRHELCGNEYPVSWSAFHDGNRCPRCSGKERMSNKRIDERIFELVKIEYIRLGDYKNNTTKFLMKHTLCGHEYMVKWADFYRGNRCPKCKESKGERKISNILNSLNIEYVTQKKFKECQYKRKLPFDFYVSNRNQKLLIEFDGIQHFKPISVFGGENGFQDTQQRDTIKNKFAKDNNIPLLRIPYTEIDNIETILVKKLKELNFIK
ncbi:MAG: endonuclease domain-containing protein [Staphylococcus equorum]|nr:endonuclease domain-containing protein [Lactococcus lactis]MDN6571126.1 endonuclease domain-containing protein [Staphylococcus equorum]MDN6120266.1 endonuclease domain-containing protein [Lactococcus lactis]MDN6504802.1 endonuclease domain-containing protein [Lactococcus lactis]MDN6587757.1 endonuclease domain-containing protein [Lactococcus lactis]